MDELFAPWRIDWVTRTAPPTDECVFCTLPDRSDDAEHLLVAQTAHAYVLLNNAPYNPGHAMVIPTRHTGDYPELREPELLEHARLTQETIRALEVAMSPDGFNTGLNVGDGAGGSIADHLHTHVVPRWCGDTNFMAVVGETKVIVEALGETYDRLHAAFAELDNAVGTADSGAVELSFD